MLNHRNLYSKWLLLSFAASLLHGSVVRSEVRSKPGAASPLLWEQTQKLTASDGDATDYFGQAMAIDGDALVVGAYGDFAPNGAYGSAYAFESSPAG